MKWELGDLMWYLTDNNKKIKIKGQGAGQPISLSVPSKTEARAEHATEP